MMGYEPNCSQGEPTLVLETLTSSDGIQAILRDAVANHV